MRNCFGIVGICILLMAVFGMSRAAAEDGPGELFSALQKQLNESRLARAVKTSDLLEDRLRSAWIVQLRSALPKAPDGWVADEIDGSGYSHSSDGGVTLQHGYSRGDGDRVAFHLDTVPNPYDKAHAGNLVWIRWARDDMLERQRYEAVRFAGREAYITAPANADDGLVVGIMLAHGATLGVVAHGQVTREELLETFGKACDVAVIEGLLWGVVEGERMGHRSGPPPARLFEHGRIHEALDKVRLFGADYAGEVGSRFQRLLPASFADRQAKEVEVGRGGASRSYEAKGKGRVDVWLGWASAPDVNGRLSTWRGDRKAGKHDVVTTVAGERVLIHRYRSYGTPAKKAYLFFLDGNFQLHLTAYDVDGDAWLETFLGRFDFPKLRQEMGKLW